MGLATAKKIGPPPREACLDPEGEGGDNIYFFEHGHVAYQIDGDDE